MEPNELRELYPDAIQEIEADAVKRYLDTQRQAVDRFTFYRTYWQAALQMPKATRERFISGLLDYAFTGVEPSLDGWALATFIGIKPNIDNSIDSITHGARGGRPKKTESERKATPAQVKRIVEHLNDKTGKSFKPSSAETIRNINARMNEGFTVDDFLTVIDNMVARWQKTDREVYLRPSTLFGTKFEGYLQARGKGSSYDEYN